MPVRLKTTDSDFSASFAALLDTKREAAEDVDAAVRAIVGEVAERGDEALIELSKKFDRIDLAKAGLKISQEEIDAGARKVSGETLAALELAKDRIEQHHRRQVPEDLRYVDALGVELGHRWTPLDSVGLYVPGGTAAYPSTVLLNAIPARVAGVERLVMTVPAPATPMSPLQSALSSARSASIRSPDPRKS